MELLVVKRTAEGRVNIEAVMADGLAVMVVAMVDIDTGDGCGGAIPEPCCWPACWKAELMATN